MHRSLSFPDKKLKHFQEKGLNPPDRTPSGVTMGVGDGLPRMTPSGGDSLMKVWFFFGWITKKNHLTNDQLEGGSGDDE